MEGLLIAEQLRLIHPLLPAERLSWRFPDSYSFVLPLSKGAIWLYNRPPNPRLARREDFPATGVTHSGFQDLLVARATGRLLELEQLKLDRVVKLYFAAAEGFVQTEPVVLVAELTGRNCNLILTDTAGMILGAAREVGQDINRFRQVRPGLRYTPPPPYDKLNPRHAAEGALREVLEGKRLKDVRKLLDGFGPDLTKVLAITAGMAPEKQLTGDDLEVVIPALKRITAEPSRMMQEALSLPDVETLRRAEGRALQLQRLRDTFGKQRGLLEKRLTDIEKTREAAAEANELRRQADVLLAYSHSVEPKANTVTLTDFEGSSLTLSLDPKLNAVENAQALYERAKKREQRAQQADTREASLQAELAEMTARLAGLEHLSIKDLDELVKTHVTKARSQVRTQPGIRYTSPQGYDILVGRNSRDNDTVTFKLARSRDVWLHVQGYTGSHVIIRADNKEIPFETILYAAQLAAAYSKAGQSDNVPVDYTLRKNVWKPKAAPAGAVHFSQQKTVYVTPSRQPERET